MCFILIGGNNMKEEKVYTQNYVEEIAWRALMLDPKIIYDWIEDLDDNEELIDLFDYLNDKLNRSIDNNMADMYKDDFMEKLKIEKLL
jgi:hypothetical protein|tara:strand:- start:59 stop:322 length:264 start_codon:yes stop_codon:yes gene_type:complete